MLDLHSLHLEPLVTRALEEDWGHGDWTTDLCIARSKPVHGQIVAKQSAVVSGLDVVRAVFRKVDCDLKVSQHVNDGAFVENGQTLLAFSGDARSLLKAERVALHFLSRMSGISTLTREFVQQLEGYKTELLDSRKTTPGLRLLEKAATSHGGARNHRLCLTDGVLIKKNHIRLAGGITQAVSQLLESLPPTLKIEVETTHLDEIHQAVEAGADLIVLDHMSIAEMALAVRTVQGRVLLVASGNVPLEKIQPIAATGVDFISTSAILHSAPWAQLSFIINP